MIEPACDLCARIEQAELSDNPFAVVRTSSGYVALADIQYHEGYTIFAAKRCVRELHELSPHERDEYLHEMALVAQAVFEAFAPRKLNYELLGNGTPHLHWHLFPRHGDDPRPTGPVWADPGFMAALRNGQPAELDHVRRLKARLLPPLERVGLSIEQRFV